MVAIAVLVIPAAASANYFYGYASDGDTSFNTDYTNCWFQYLTVVGVQNYQQGCPASGTKAASNGGVQFTAVRIDTPWDTIDTATSASGNPTCEQSWLAALYQQTYWTPLINAISNAEHDGLTPVVVLENSPTGLIGQADNDNSNGTPSDNDYFCGLYGLMYELSATGHHVGAFELYNEPDCASNGMQCDKPANVGLSEFDGDALNKYGHTCADCGKYAAADLYGDAWWARYGAEQYNGGIDANDYLIAGGLSQWSLDDTTNNGNSYYDGFMNQYAAQIANWANEGYGWPQRWSGHDYTDTTTGGSNGTAEAWNLVDIVHNWDPGAWIWLTETADWLDNLEYGSTDGNPTAQAAAGAEFMSIPGPTPSGGVSPEDTPVAYVEGDFWYSFWPGNTSTTWDSALVDSNFGLRESYCVLAGDYGQSWCGQGNPNDTLDPGPPTG